jgi:hypothetical protein
MGDTVSAKGSVVAGSEGQASWQNEPPTRPVSSSSPQPAVSRADAPAPIVTMTFERPRPVLDTSAAHAASPGAPANAAPAAPSHVSADPEASDIADCDRISIELDSDAADGDRSSTHLASDAGDDDRSSIRLDSGGPWFETMRPPALPPEMMMTERLPSAPRPQPWMGWTMVTVAIGASMCILAEAVRVRIGAAAHGEPALVAAVPDPALPVNAPVVAPPAPEAKANDTAARDKNAAQPGANTGELRLPAGHRIFVDGRPVSERQGRLRLACGEHSVRFGSRGTTKTVLVPCGGSVTPTL